MKTYTIKQPIFELWVNEYGKMWHVTNINEILYISFHPYDSLQYGASYCFEEYYKEGYSRFKTLGEAKEWLIDKYNKYVARNLDEVK